VRWEKEREREKKEERKESEDFPLTILSSRVGASSKSGIWKSRLRLGLKVLGELEKKGYRVGPV